MRFRVPNSFAFIAIVIASSPFLFAQPAEKSYYLHDGDTVVFYGDSITEQRYYTQDVDVYTVTRFPHMQVQFFNAGVGGDRVSGGSAGSIDTRLPRDVFPQKPTVVTIMLGMNDGGYGNLTPEIESKYTQGYEHILNSLETALPGVRLSLLGPSPYDEVTRPAKVPGGYNSTLTHFSEIDSELARKHNATFIDLNAPFVASLNRGAAIDPLATELLLPDRVHPEPMAHWFMAAAILKGWNAPSIVSSTTIDAKQLTTIETKNAHVSDLSAKQSGISWTQLDDALPLPFDDDKNAANHFLQQITDIERDLNQQLLTVHGLAEGNYQFTIDGTPIGIFTNAELNTGVNLARLSTPMRGQAFRVSWLVRDRDDAHYVRLQMFVNQMKYGTSAEPGASDLLQFEKELQKRIYEFAQPKSHQYQLKAIATPN
ncbi:SGNH/GDSL hydrolase family protein [Acidicapsa acidisoli]|uniref:SGNH/GDSL hydrolase family protein n=1 Tax=Acidicapsa acidisoli TaxID=1615681 RepID=UPI0021DF54A0|nr:SGNH/GDSL hydrolase family protein [Acidicapsa acidisoli]